MFERFFLWILSFFSPTKTSSPEVVVPLTPQGTPQVSNPIPFPTQRPSNAPVGYPSTSPEGYQYFYPIGGDGKPTGEPFLMYEAQNFPNVKELEEYKVRVIARRGQPDIDYNTPGVGFPVFSADDVRKALVAYTKGVQEGREDLAWYQITQKEKYALQNDGAKAAAINAKVNQYNSGATPDGWNESFQKSFRGL